jgi:hypothetical protein
MQPHGGGLGLVEKKCRHSLAHIGAQFLPRVALRENVMRKTFSDITAIAFLRHGEDNFHDGIIALKVAENKPFFAPSRPCIKKCFRANPGFTVGCAEAGSAKRTKGKLFFKSFATIAAFARTKN